MEQTWESLFSEQAKIEGHSQQYISECLAYAGILQSHNVPVIFDKWHFFSFFPDIKNTYSGAYPFNFRWRIQSQNRLK